MAGLGGGGFEDGMIVTLEMVDFEKEAVALGMRIGLRMVNFLRVVTGFRSLGGFFLMRAGLDVKEGVRVGL